MSTVFTNKYPKSGLNDMPGQFAVPSVPVPPILSRQLEHALVLSLNLGAMLLDIFQNVRNLFDRELETVTNQRGRAAGGQVVHHVVERDACAGDGEATLVIYELRPK